jgi:hypothetical protein
MISAHGPAARRYADAYPGLDAVIADPDHLTDAYIEAVRRHERGVPFYGMLLLDETRTRTLERIAPALFAQWPGFDERRAAVDQFGLGEARINGRPAREVFAEVDPGLRQSAAEFFLLANAVLVRSHAEYARINAFCPRPRPFERIVCVPALPALERHAPHAPAVVVWATDIPAEHAALYAFALSEFHGSVTVVAGAGTPPAGFGATFLPAAHAGVGTALAAASAVLVTDPADPGYAIAFARLGYGVAAPLSSGAHEYVRDVMAFDPGAPRTIQIAASMAIAQAASVREFPAEPPRAPHRPGTPARADAPLITVVIPTYNRRADLTLCLDGMAAQTYPNVEALVVNDAGESVDDIVARYPFARLLDLKQNVGNAEALAAGTRAARGSFIGWTADDDWLYPDHLERLADALVRSGASIAHTNGLIRHQDRLADRSLTTVGFNAGVFIDTTTPTDSLIATAIVLISFLFRREIFDEVQPQLDGLELPDHEVQLRMAQKYVFAYVDQMTVEWRLRGESSFANKDSPGGMRHIFEVMHPRPDRPMIERARRESVENVAKRPPGRFMFPPTILVNENPQPR